MEHDKRLVNYSAHDFVRYQTARYRIIFFQYAILDRVSGCDTLERLLRPLPRDGAYLTYVIEFGCIRLQQHVLHLQSWLLNSANCHLASLVYAVATFFQMQKG